MQSLSYFLYTKNFLMYNPSVASYSISNLFYLLVWTDNGVNTGQGNLIQTSVMNVLFFYRFQYPRFPCQKLSFIAF